MQSIPQDPSEVLGTALRTLDGRGGGPLRYEQRQNDRRARAEERIAKAQAKRERRRQRSLRIASMAA